MMEFRVGDKVRITQNCPVYGYRGKEGRIISINIGDWETLLTVEFSEKITTIFNTTNRLSESQVFNSVYVEQIKIWSVS